jgi:NADH-quinone oxidoreductase subunit L
VFEHKFYFDELYDALFYRPAVAISGALRRNVEEPVIERSLDEIGSGTIQVGGEVARVQSGLLRTYAVAIASAVCVLIVVFVASVWSQKQPGRLQTLRMRRPRRPDIY